MATPKRTVIIDADIPVFQSAAIADTVTDWGEGLWTLHAYECDATQWFDKFIADIMEKLNGTDLILALSDSENWRKDVLPTYKHNRAKTRPPMLRKFMNQYAIDNYNVMQRPTLEGDDILGILATSKTIVKGDKVIVSIDKDLKTIPCQILNWNHASSAVSSGLAKSVNDCVFTVTKEQADYYHLLQTLAGDTTDGYGGCPNIGLGTADTILSDEPHIVVRTESELKSGKNKGQMKVTWVKTYGDYTPWQTIVSYFEKAGLNEEEALVQARVARICRNTEYNFKKKEVALWTPHTKS